MIKLNKNIHARIEFECCHIKYQYDSILVRIINQTQGEIDRMIFYISDIIGEKPIDSNTNIIKPYLWLHNYNYYTTLNWYQYEPTKDELKKIYETITKYICMFK